MNTQENHVAGADERTGLVSAETLPVAQTHELKVWPNFLDALIDGSKTFEVRKHDRNFKVGDRLFLYEFDPVSETVGHRYVYKAITYVMKGGWFGVVDGYVVLGLVDALAPAHITSSMWDALFVADQPAPPASE